jgi:hypothetical protein
LHLFSLAQVNDTRLFTFSKRNDTDYLSLLFDEQSFKQQKNKLYFC